MLQAHTCGLCVFVHHAINCHAWPPIAPLKTAYTYTATNMRSFVCAHMPAHVSARMHACMRKRMHARTRAATDQLPAVCVHTPAPSRRYGTGMVALDVRDQFLCRAHFAAGLLVSERSKGFKVRSWRGSRPWIPDEQGGAGGRAGRPGGAVGGPRTCTSMHARTDACMHMELVAGEVAPQERAPYVVLCSIALLPHAPMHSASRRCLPLPAVCRAWLQGQPLINGTLEAVKHVMAGESRARAESRGTHAYGTCGRVVGRVLATTTATVRSGSEQPHGVDLWQPHASRAPPLDTLPAALHPGLELPAPHPCSLLLVLNMCPHVTRKAILRQMTRKANMPALPAAPPCHHQAWSLRPPTPATSSWCTTPPCTTGAWLHRCTGMASGRICCPRRSGSRRRVLVLVCVCVRAYAWSVCECMPACLCASRGAARMHAPRVCVYTCHACARG